MISDIPDNNLVCRSLKMRLKRGWYDSVGDKNSLSIMRSNSQNPNMILSIGNYGSYNMVLEMKMEDDISDVSDQDDCSVYS